MDFWCKRQPESSDIRTIVLIPAVWIQRRERVQGLPVFCAYPLYRISCMQLLFKKSEYLFKRREKRGENNVSIFFRLCR
ncbi:hypothetical protein EI42_02800 [Thermosporothrix hazakensis]|uniref:Uncharacterized protein n=1 Tax=Thermosporothrix hazakensis TaxID=644383 RepID=A0A326UAI7_THEHA|nr:hypothetical protein EI42_02800 [Thermosporothrix hazakensis]